MRYFTGKSIEAFDGPNEALVDSLRVD